MALFSSARYLSRDNKLRIAFTIREELVDKKLAPLAPSIGFDYQIFKRLKVLGNISRSYRTPTFNDIYWVGVGSSGNPNLNPEASWSQELGIKSQVIENSNFQSSLKTTIFNSTVDNWILWEQVSSIWTPNNVRQVWARGVETNLSTIAKIGAFSLHGNLVYNYNITSATDKKVSINGNRSKLQKQLPYTPQHEASILFKASFKGYSWTWIHTYTGKQYTDSDNSEIFSLPPYQILNTFISKSFSYRQTSFYLKLMINNILNTSYENRRGYPLYGRNFSLSLTLKFTQKDDEQKTNE